jgi:hypothetical protein
MARAAAKAAPRPPALQHPPHDCLCGKQADALRCPSRDQELHSLSMYNAIS